MNIQERDIMKILLGAPFVNQRMLSEQSGHSLGVVNRSLKKLAEEGYLDEAMCPTEKARALDAEMRPRSAVILAAGFGMRMVPINLETPKAFLEVKGEALIERQIRQLQEVGITDITVVVGFMKDKFEYLIDEFGVRLVVNREYASRNNLYSMRLVADRLSNTYIVPCDIWCRENPFSRHELYSWYMVSDREDEGSDVRVNRKRELVAKGTGGEKKPSAKAIAGDKAPAAKAAAGNKTTAAKAAASGNAMIGIAYLDHEDAQKVSARIKELCDSYGHSGDFWEQALYEKGRMIIPARVVCDADAIEINTYEQLRDLDSDSSHLQSEVLNRIAQVFGCETEEITEITVLKKGMTNRSFLFSCRGGKYIMRVPGEGTDKLINRRQEAAVYAAISGKGLCDDPVYIDPETGYKITRYLEGVRVCDADSLPDLQRCMAKLRAFHGMGLKVEHEFDIFGQIEFYEGLWEGRPSVYRDYKAVKERVFSLKPFIDSQIIAKTLTHIDAVPDNFLFYRAKDSEPEQLQLTDWEYAGMQDPHVDIAMFCIYSLYDKEQVDRLIGIYFDAGESENLLSAGESKNPLSAEESENPLSAGESEELLSAVPTETVAKIYAYIAACGLLWSNWCEYKLSLGVEFGEYSLRQYRFAKEYCRYAAKLIREMEET